MGRQAEINNDLFAPVFQSAKNLVRDLNYEPPVFRPGWPAVQSVDESQVWIIIRQVAATREPQTISGSMWCSEQTVEVSYSVPERVPSVKIHNLISNTMSGLVDHYTSKFCDDVNQLYIDDVRWDTQIDASARTEYVLRIDYRYYEYPQGG